MTDALRGFRAPWTALAASAALTILAWGGPTARADDDAASASTTVAAKPSPLDAVAPAPTYNIAQVARINQEVRQTWRDSNLMPSPEANDGEWCRRVFLDIIGRVPTVAELTQFLASKDPEKKRILVDSLLTDDQYVEEYARNWTTVWTNLLIGRAGGTDDDSLISRDGDDEVSSATRSPAANRMTRWSTISSPPPARPAPGPKTSTGPSTSLSTRSTRKTEPSPPPTRRGSFSASRSSAPSATTTPSTSGSSRSSGR